MYVLMIKCYGLFTLLNVALCKPEVLVIVRNI